MRRETQEYASSRCGSVRRMSRVLPSSAVPTSADSRAQVQTRRKLMARSGTVGMFVSYTQPKSSILHLAWLQNTMQRSTPLHLAPSINVRELNSSVDIIGGIEKRKASRQQCQQTHACRPYVDFCACQLMRDNTHLLVVCEVHLKSTSGARKPRVPARLARLLGRASLRK